MLSRGSGQFFGRSTTLNRIAPSTRGESEQVPPGLTCFHQQFTRPPSRSSISIHGGDTNVMPLLGFFVAVGLLAVRQFNFFPPNFLVRDQAKEMCDAVKPRAPLVVRINDVPRGNLGMRSGEHVIACARVIVPTPMSLEVHWAELPDFAAVIDPGHEALVLIFVAHL